MSKSRRNIRVHAVRRDPPDLRRLSRALIQLAQAQAEADAQAQHEAEQPRAVPPAAPPRARGPRRKPEQAS